MPLDDFTGLFATLAARAPAASVETFTRMVGEPESVRVYVSASPARAAAFFEGMLNGGHTALVAKALCAPDVAGMLDDHAARFLMRLDAAQKTEVLRAPDVAAKLAYGGHGYETLHAIADLASEARADVILSPGFVNAMVYKGLGPSLARAVGELEGDALKRVKSNRNFMTQLEKAGPAPDPQP
jgi:hypothetical protein